MPIVRMRMLCASYHPDRDVVVLPVDRVNSVRHAYYAAVASLKEGDIFQRKSPISTVLNPHFSWYAYKAKMS